MGLENDIPDTPSPSTRQTTITLANSTRQASTTTHVSANAVRMINLLNAKASMDHVGGNFPILAESHRSRTRVLRIKNKIKF